MVFRAVGFPQRTAFCAGPVRCVRNASCCVSMTQFIKAVPGAERIPVQYRPARFTV